MKALSVLALGLLLPALAVKTKQLQRLQDDDDESPTTITKVVGLLKGMAEQSKVQEEEEESVFKKFECYSTKMIKDKTESISDLKELIESTDNRIFKLTALLDEVEAKKKWLEEDLAQNHQDLLDCNATRAEGRAAFQKEEQEMRDGLAGLEKVVETLSKDLDMSLVLLEKSSNPMLLALTKQLKESSASQDFLKQVPSSSTSALTGAINTTKQSFESELAKLRAREEEDIKAYLKLYGTLMTKKKELGTMLSQAESTIASSTEELGTRREALTQANEDLKSDKELLTVTQDSLKEKTKTYDTRQSLRMQEQAAIAEAISTLNSDDSFEAFSKTQRTSSKAADFLQFSSSHELEAGTAQIQKQVLALLRTSARTAHSVRLAHLASEIGSKPWTPEDEKKNPFAVVLGEIDKMQKVIENEEAADLKKFSWCESERATSNGNKDSKIAEIANLKTGITDIKDTLNSPEDGLVVTLATAERDLKANQEAQTEATALRKSENQEYQKNIANLQSAQKLIKHALSVLDSYYKKIALLQVKRAQAPADGAAPEYDPGKYEGVSSGGNAVIQQITEILDDTVKEEDEAHATEQKAQADFEKTMKDLTDAEANEKSTIRDTTKEIADKKIELDEKTSEKAETTKEKESIEAYLKEIKPGCDFIAANYAQRKVNREAEATSLTNAVTLIKQTPAYVKFEDQKSSER